MRPAGLFALGVFFVAALALLVGARRLARRAELERADELLRAEYEALRTEGGGNDKTERAERDEE
jgi:hypothetical protein